MSTTQAQRIAVRAAREALAELPEPENNEQPFYWIGRMRAAVELLLGAYAPEPPLAWETVSLPEPENQAGPTCARCGSGAVVTLHADGEYRCHNPKRCAERVAARDAEAAQVTR